MPFVSDRFTLFRKAVAAINSSLDIDQVLEQVTDSVIEITGAERGFVMLNDLGTGELVVRVARTFAGETIAPGAHQVSTTILKEVQRASKGLTIVDAQGDEQFRAAESIIGFQLRSVMCAPLLRKGDMLGLVYVDNRYDAGVFDENDLDILQGVADQAAIALDNARLFAGLQAQMGETASLKEYQDNIFRSVSNGVIALDLEGRIMSANLAAARIFNFDPVAVVGQYYTAALGPEMSMKMLRPVARAVRGGPDYNEQTELRAAIQRRGYAYLTLRVSSLLGAENEQVGIVLVVDDVTERRTLEEARRQGEAERLRIREIFGRQVSDEVVDTLLKDTTKLSLGGERAEVTVLFADVRGYTGLSERLPAEDVVRLLNEYFTIATHSIRAEGGWLDKFVGDAVVAVFNAPLPQVDHADRAVRAALAMQRAVGEMRSMEIDDCIEFGIGINTGVVIVGNVGSVERMSYTVIGDTVNVASRLQTSAAPGQIILTAETVEKLTEPVALEHLGPLTVKGRREPVQVYQTLCTS